MNERELRRLLEKIEIKYLHQPSFKLTASQKYIEACTNLLTISETFEFNDLHTAFNLVIKPLSVAIDSLKTKKDPETLDVFFIECIELFLKGVERAEGAGQLESAHKARLMCLDVHKLRLLCSDNDSSSFEFTREFINSIIRKFPEDGRFWFQHAIIQFTFDPSYHQQQQQQQIDQFSTLNSLCRALLASSNPVEAATVASFLEKRAMTGNFSNTLLSLALNDFQDFATKDLQTWSFVKYFQSFSAGSDVNLSLSELAHLLLFVLAFYRVSRNSFHLKIFFEAFLSAKNQSIADFWPFAVHSLLSLALQFGQDNTIISDSTWFRIFQLLKSESSTIISAPSNLASSTHFKSFFNGTILNSSRGPATYDFNEEFSLERDSMINTLAEHFDHENGAFKQFITLRSDRTLRLGSHFCSQESESESDDDLNRKVSIDARKYTLQLGSQLDDSIEELRGKLASLSSSTPVAAQDDACNYLNAYFILDTNVLLSGSAAIRSELLQRPDRFLIPLVVLSELAKLSEYHEKASFAKNALEFLDPLLAVGSAQVYSSYGRLIEPAEIENQLGFLKFIYTPVKNDDQIIELANQFHANNPQLPKPILITEDLNMRLKAKSKAVRAISIKDFRNMCNC